MNKIKINNLKKGIDGMKLYLSTFHIWPGKDVLTNWNFINTTCNSYINAFFTEGLMASEITSIMKNCFDALLRISETMELEIDERILDFINEHIEVQNEQ